MIGIMRLYAIVGAVSRAKVDEFNQIKVLIGMIN